MLQTRSGAVRRPLVVTLVSSVLLLLGLGQASAQADVTAVKGSAYGYSCVVSAFGNACTPPGPTPTVTLAANASNSPQTASAASARADAGPATIFSSGQLDVSTQGTLGPTGSVTSSTNIANVNASGQENFTASNLASTCTASQTGASGSTTITGGTLQTDNGDSDPTNTIPDHLPVTVTLPTSPAPNTGYDGHVHIGNTTDSFRWVFNEQTVNADGSLTVNAAHEYLLGPSAVGNLILGQVVCGVTFVADTTPPQTTIDSGPSGTISTGSASFTFSSSEAGSTFQCKLDGPGATTGTYGSCTSPKAYTSLADGTYTFSVRATDAAGNTDATPATSTFTVNTTPVDTTPPQTTIDSGPSGTITTSSATFTFSSSETPSTFECKLDGPGATTGTYSSCTSPKAYTSLADGTYTFSVRATDAAGNTDATPATRTFTVNTTPASVADLSVDLSDSPDPVAARGELAYTINVTNHGPDTATGVTVFTTTDKGTKFVSAAGATCTVVKGKDSGVRCDLGSLASGDSTQFTIVIKVGGKPLTATSTVSSTTSDPVPGNNTDTETTQIAP